MIQFKYDFLSAQLLFVMNAAIKGGKRERGSGGATLTQGKSPSFPDTCHCHVWVTCKQHETTLLRFILFTMQLYYYN